jgi:hypothetical protein
MPSFSLGARSATVQLWLVNKSILIDICHVAACSPLRRVPEVPHSISGWFQSVPQRVVPDTP